ncbi:hypothetical protein ACQ9BO_25845 [Flavobacterium sp. P21]|uniref:hypothetical protein n=1 Tax=Flavobacterium sp. P21 TaxID=3423948 RepID=UPI003D67A1C2
MAVSLDFLYTTVYLQSNARQKVSYAYTSVPKKIDVVILGSSRADNHFVSEMFIAKGLKAFNFGMQGSRLFESDLVLKLLLEKKIVIKNVIVEVDLNIRSDLNKYSTSNILWFMPYLYDSESIQNHFKDLPGYKCEYYIPFYRYVKYESKIGFREMFFTALNKKSNVVDQGGFYPLMGSGEKLKSNLSSWYPSRNIYYEEIKELCKQNHINLVAIMTPMCENSKGINYFEKVKKCIQKFIIVKVL